MVIIYVLRLFEEEPAGEQDHQCEVSYANWETTSSGLRFNMSGDLCVQAFCSSCSSGDVAAQETSY